MAYWEAPGPYSENKSRYHMLLCFGQPAMLFRIVFHCPPIAEHTAALHECANFMSTQTVCGSSPQFPGRTCKKTAYSRRTG
jgi:hypothetical protein